MRTQALYRLIFYHVVNLYSQCIVVHSAHYLTKNVKKETRFENHLTILCRWSLEDDCKTMSKRLVTCALGHRCDFVVPLDYYHRPSATHH